MRNILFVLLCVGVSGCGANFNSIFRDNSLDEHKITFVDAKQRAIISRQEVTRFTDADGNTTTDSIPITCAEPSPDVFSVLSASLAASGTFEEPGGPSAAAEVAASLSETGANIGLRTQSIQLLRDFMFRVCERFMNKAISPLELRVQAARDQRTITTLLAIEQLTGAVRPQPVVISNSASADTGASLVAAQKNLDAARADFTTKKQAADKAEKGAAAAEAAATAKAAEADAEQDAAKKKLLKDEADALKKTAADKRGIADTKKADADEAAINVKSYEEKRDAARTLQTKGTATAQIGELPKDCCKLTDRETEVIASTVADLVRQVYDDDEILLSCLSLMIDVGTNRNLVVSTPKQVFDFCATYLANDAVTKKARLATTNPSVLRDLNVEIEKLRPTQE